MKIHVSVRSHTEYRLNGHTTMIIFDLFYHPSSGRHYNDLGYTKVGGYSPDRIKAMDIIHKWLDDNCKYEKATHLITGVRIESDEDVALIMLRFHETDIEL